jgi:hypothetical protein
MLFVSLMRWWYGFGWLDQAGLVRNRLDKVADYFSIELLLRTFFKPFRQIDADRAQKGSLDVVLRGMLDQLFSRVIGALIRLFMIVFGSIVVALETLVGLARLVVWPVLPLLPLLGLVLSLKGWLPWL